MEILEKNSVSCSQIHVSGGLFDLRDTARVAIADEGSFEPNANNLNRQCGKDGALTY